MIEAGDCKIVFCCARGIFRSVEASGMVSGSDCIDGGYVGIYQDWMGPMSPDEQIHDIQLFYGGTCIVLIADAEDLQNETHAQALKFTADLLDKAKIAHIQIAWISLLKQIATEERVSLQGVTL